MTNDNVLPFPKTKIRPSSDEEIKAGSFSLERVTPFLDLPPGGRIEVGLGCLFISLRPNAGLPQRKNWNIWITHLEERLKSMGSSYELLQERKGFVDGIRIRVLYKSAERTPPM
ncbi:MAG TPA: hypothetical protein VHL10_02890 [Nitrososphaera sp.]|nr:hypothetical protein [Nitrososphaera sp.]